MEEEQERLRQMEVEQQMVGLDALLLASEPQTPDPVPDTGLGQEPEVLADSNGTDQPIPTAHTEGVTTLEQQSVANTKTPTQPSPGLTSRPGMAISLERNGLCVICQDEEANIAIVDCGWVFLISRRSSCVDAAP